MKPAGDTAAAANGQRQPLRLAFDAGTLIVEGLPEADEPGLPGVKFDFRTKQFRAEAIWYRTIVEHLRKHKENYTYADAARAYEPHRLAAPGRQGGVPAPGRGPKPGGTTGAAAWSSCRPEPARPTWPTWPSSEPAGPPWSSRPTIDLMNQWYDELTLSFGTEVGLLGGGYYDIQPLTVTTYDSAYLNMDRLGNRFGFIVFDECHHLPGPTYGLAATCAIAPFRLGLTATPERADNAHTHLDQLIGPIVYRREITQLRGHYLADYRVMTLYVQLNDEERSRYELAREIYRGFVHQRGHQHEPAQRLGPVHLPGAPLARGPPSLPRLSRAARAGPGRAGQARPAGPLARPAQRRPHLDLHPRQRDRLQDRPAVPGARHHPPDQDQGTARDPAPVQRRHVSDRRDFARARTRG